ncbi:hypothetical protein EW026_g8390 [Hermanssonia centrifuga]|uniref:Uncharacterized protein n=1 Tax=Hermanssonia centrifuga TaxID=98765 RepID=A0A4S4K490_9APHY|nr:hypothetical protein EW026_g8390 [Hermanssonia centrifuga]
MPSSYVKDHKKTNFDYKRKLVPCNCTICGGQLQPRHTVRSHHRRSRVETDSEDDESQQLAKAKLHAKKTKRENKAHAKFRTFTESAPVPPQPALSHVVSLQPPSHAIACNFIPPHHVDNLPLCDTIEDLPSRSPDPPLPASPTPGVIDLRHNLADQESKLVSNDNTNSLRVCSTHLNHRTFPSMRNNLPLATQLMPST